MINRIKFGIVLALFASSSIAVASEEFQDVSFQKDAQFTRKNSLVFVECYDARSFSEKKIALRSFKIKLHEDKTEV